MRPDKKTPSAFFAPTVSTTTAVTPAAEQNSTFLAPTQTPPPPLGHYEQHCAVTVPPEFIYNTKR